MPEITNGEPSPSSFLRCLPVNCRNVFDIQLVMGKESSGTSPNGRGSVKRPEMQEIIQVNLTVRKKGRITLPAYNNYYYMDVHFSAKMFPSRINK